MTDISKVCVSLSTCGHMIEKKQLFALLAHMSDGAPTAPLDAYLAFAASRLEDLASCWELTDHAFESQLSLEAPGLSPDDFVEVRSEACLLSWLSAL